MLDKFGNCPNCTASWDDGDIPERYHQHYSPPYKYSRVIALYDWHLDRTVGYSCPDCNAQFGRDGK